MFKRAICKSENPFFFKNSKFSIEEYSFSILTISWISVKNHGSMPVFLWISSIENSCLIASLTFNILNALPSFKDLISSSLNLLISKSSSRGSFVSNPGKLSSRERKAFWNDSLNVLPIAIASPTDCICTPSFPEADENFSKSNLGSFVTM